MNALLEKIQKIDGEIRVYALNGFAMALANEIEDTMFWCYVGAKGLDFEEAASDFYRTIRFKDKQDTADKAISEKLDPTPDIETWKALNVRIQALLGEGNSLRNLIGHNIVSINAYVLTDKYKGDESTVIEIRHEVQEKAAMVKVKGRAKVKVGVDELTDYCDKLFNLYLDLEHFAHNVLQFGSTNPKRYLHGA